MADDQRHNQQRPREDSGYFESFNPAPVNLSDYKSQYPAESQDLEDMAIRSNASSNAARQSPPPQSKPAAPSRRDDDVLSNSSHPEVTAELIAEITEKVKREVFESLKKNGGLDDGPKSPPPLQRTLSNKSSSTSSPPPASRKVYTPPSPAHTPKQGSPTMESAKFQPPSPLEKPAGVRFSNRDPPRAPFSAVDQKWGRLFEADGTHTPRLTQFLRGLANHLISDVEPKRSLVVTPLKMATFYETHSLERETYKFTSIFRAQVNEHISRLYQDLGCEFHLVQDQPAALPTVPALTPEGFCKWLIIQIKAYPEEEAARLNNILQAWAIDADGALVDGKPERLPKQLSRHLLPGKEDKTSRKLLDNAIDAFFDDLGSSNRRYSSITSPPLSRRSSYSPSHSPASNTVERERMPYTSNPSASRSEQTEEGFKERERKPYVAQPGSGKVYVEPGNVNVSPNSRGRANSTGRVDRDQIHANDETRSRRTQNDSYRNTDYSSGRRMSGKRSNSPQFKNHRHSTSDIGQGSAYTTQPPFEPSSFGSQSFSPGSYGRPRYDSSFSVPPPPPIDIRGPRRDEYDHRRRDEDPRITAEFNSPRDAERWDRFEDMRASEDARYGRSYESRSNDGRDPRVVSGFEDYYKSGGRSNTYNSHPRH